MFSQRHGARVISQTETRPSVILQRLDIALRQRPSLSPCTALCVLLGDDDQITFCSAGHPLPLLVGRGDVRELGAPQRLIGLPHPYCWRDQSIAIEADEMLVLHTDGITDARGARERFGDDRLRALLQRHASVAPDVLLAELEATLDAFQVGPQADDIALIALRRQPIAPAGDDTIRHRTSATVARSTQPHTTRGRPGRVSSRDAVLLSACVPHRRRRPADTSG